MTVNERCIQIINIVTWLVLFTRLTLNVKARECVDAV